MSQVIAFANQKGGVGKTTATINIAYALAQKGQRVLAVDMDPQASLTIYFGHDPLELEEKHKTIFWGLTEEDVNFESLIQDGNPALIGASIQLSEAEIKFAQEWDSTSFVKDNLSSVRDKYDFILIDCPPTLTLLTVNALVAADSVLVPVKTDFLSIMGLQLLLRTIASVRRRQNPNLAITGILPTMFDSRNNHDNGALEQLKTTYSSDLHVFEPIGRSTQFDNAAMDGRSTLELLPNAPAAQNFYPLADHLIDYATKQKTIL